MTGGDYIKVVAGTIEELLAWLVEQRPDAKARMCPVCGFEEDDLVVSRFFETPLPDEVAADSSNAFIEGALREITVNAYERDRAARAACVAKFGTRCSVPTCGFDFGRVYGTRGDGYFHVHHLRPLSEIRESYELNPVRDLRPVCPNCHAMLHAPGDLLSIEELNALMRAART